MKKRNRRLHYFIALLLCTAVLLTALLVSISALSDEPNAEETQKAEPSELLPPAPYEGPTEAPTNPWDAEVRTAFLEPDQIPS